jgi:CubicO group peptidase (beta-lactamase class C family)
MTISTACSSRRAFLGGGLALGAATLAPRHAFAGSDMAAAHWPTVARMVDDYVGGGKVSGMVSVLGFGAGRGEVIARGKLAIGNAPAIGRDSLFRVYSMTKPLTGMCAMMLIDEGKMKLDQPLADILPKFAKMQVQVTPDGAIDQLRPASGPITIRQLLTHTAGLGYSIIQHGPIKAAYEAAGVIPGQISRMSMPGLDRGKPAASLAQFADHLAGLPLVYEPGTHWSYSVGLDLMGRVIEVVSGQPFDKFMHDRIIGPTGMTSTYFQVPQSDVGRLTTNYAVAKGVLLPLDPARSSIYLDKPAFPFGGAGLVSSPADYDRFLTMLLGYGVIDGRRVMSEAAVRMGTGNLLPAGVDTSKTMISGAGFGAGGRVGVGIDAGTYGWGGAAGTIAFVNYRVKNRASLFTQYMPDNTYPIHAEFPKAVIADLLAGRKVAA